MNIIRMLICMVTILIVTQSCRKDLIIENEVGIVKSPSTEVEGSIFGVVRDQIGNPVENAFVKVGSHESFTDEKGVFQFNNINLISSYEVLYEELSDVFPLNNIPIELKGSYITIEKDGYFLGSRRFYPEKGKLSSIDIQLLEHVEVGSFQSSTSAILNFEGTELQFDENSIIKESGETYNGNVHVMAKYIDPSEYNVGSIMPGDLTGINAEAGLVNLSSFSMIAVELRGDAGELLQIAGGESVLSKFFIPPTLVSNAPATIPIWSFQESQGIWIHEGEATLENGKYVAELTHFSFWNCDYPNPTIFLNGRVINDSGPISGALIRITDPSLGTSAVGYTNNVGEFSGYVPANEILLLELFNNCGEIQLSMDIGPFSEDNAIQIIVESEESITFLTGQVTSCQNNDLEYAYVQVQLGEKFYTFPIDELNSFNEQVLYCNDAQSVFFQAIDPVSGLVSNQVVSAINDTINIGMIEICDSLYQEHYLYNYGDLTFYFSPDDETLTSSLDSFVDPMTGEISKFLLSTSIYNFTTGTTTNQAWPIDLAQPFLTYSFTVFEGGFKASGTIEGKIEIQNGNKWAIITGTLTEIEIIDSVKYDPSYTELFFHIAVKI